MATNSKNGTIRRGTVQSLIRANGGWMAVVTAFTSEPGQPVWSHLVPIDQLRGPARKKADRWLEALS